MCPARDVRVARLSRVAAVVLALQLAAAPVHVGGCSKPDRLAPSSNCTAPLSLNMRGGTGDWPVSHAPLASPCPPARLGLQRCSRLAHIVPQLTPTPYPCPLGGGPQALAQA